MAMVHYAKSQGLPHLLSHSIILQSNTKLMEISQFHIAGSNLLSQQKNHTPTQTPTGPSPSIIIITIFLLKIRHENNNIALASLNF